MKPAIVPFAVIEIFESTIVPTFLVTLSCEPVPSKVIEVAAWPINKALDRRKQKEEKTFFIIFFFVCKFITTKKNDR